MNDFPRVMIEARLFILTHLGGMKQAGQLTPDTMDLTKLQADLSRLYPLESWHERGLITDEQLTGWIIQALALLSEPGNDLRE